jgi:hypothetical protein
MPLRDYQGMARGDGVAVVDGQGVIVCEDDFGNIWRAERAGIHIFF